MPESVHWLARKQPEWALAKINTALSRMKFPRVDGLQKTNGREEKLSPTSIFFPSLAPITLILTTAYFPHITTFYFILKRLPKNVLT